MSQITARIFHSFYRRSSLFIAGPIFSLPIRTVISPCSAEDLPSQQESGHAVLLRSGLGPLTSGNKEFQENPKNNFGQRWTAMDSDESSSRPSLAISRLSRIPT
jgi:hypothetical protein